MSGSNKSSNQPAAATVIILCGGKGSRLQGIDKPLLEIDQTPIVERICAGLAGLGPVLISANRNTQLYQRYGTVIADQERDLGPLAGLAACLKYCRTENALIVPGDCPDYSRGLAERLLFGLNDTTQTFNAVCAHDGQRQQHLHLALKVSALSKLQHYLDLGGRSVKGWLKELASGVVDCAEFTTAFADIDNAQDLAKRQSSVRDSHSLNR